MPRYFTVNHSTSTSDAYLTNTTSSVEFTRIYISTSSSSTYQVRRRHILPSRNICLHQERILDSHKEDAKIRSMDLLNSNLNDDQRKTFQDRGWFDVFGNISKKKYRIKNTKDLVANIFVYDKEGLLENRMCGHCDIEEIPLGDHLLAQKLSIEHDEESFLEISNRFNPNVGHA